MQQRTVIRLIDGQLAWYPPGTQAGAQRIDSADSLATLAATAGQPGALLCFAAPGADVTLLPCEFTAAEKKHINKALPYMLEEQLLQDVDDLHLSTHILSGTSLSAAVCSKEQMLQWQQQLEELPAMAQWVPEPLLLPFNAGQWTIVLEEHQAIVRTGVGEGFAVELEFLATMLEAVGLEDDQEPEAIVVYGVDEETQMRWLPDALAELLQWRQGDFSTAMLLSEGSGEGSSSTVNLLQGEYARRLPLERWWQQWQAVAAVFAVAFVLQLVAGYANYRDLEQQNVQLRQQIESSYRQAFPKGNYVDAEKQLTRQLNSMRGSAQTSGFTPLMNQVGAIIATKPGARIASINYNDKGGDMRLNITAKDFEAVESIRTAMVSKGLKAVMENSNAQGNEVRARLRVGAGS